MDTLVTMTEPRPIRSAPPSPLDQWPPVWSPRAVVFDFDGLLVDTEAEWIRVQDSYLAMHGAQMDADTRREITGQAAAVVVTVIGTLVDKDPHQVGEELLAAHREGLQDRDQLVPLPGGLETVRAIAAKRPVAIASNSPREMLDHKLDATGLIDVVDAHVAVEDIARPKPAPDIYLRAAELLGADPADCLGFEDSETGATAAVSAGLHLIAVPSLPGQDPVAPRRLESLEDAVLQEWIAGWDVQR